MRRCQTISTAPSDAREARARAVLKSIDECLDILWVWKAVHTDDVNEEVVHWEGRYAIITYFKSHDPELALTRACGAPNPHMVLGWYTQDMNRAESPMLPCDEMEPKVRSFLGKMDGEQRNHAQRMAALEISEFQRSEKLKADTLDQSVWEAMEHRREHVGIPYVGQYTTRRG